MGTVQIPNDRLDNVFSMAIHRAAFVFDGCDSAFAHGSAVGSGTGGGQGFCDGRVEPLLVRLAGQGWGMGNARRTNGDADGKDGRG